MTRSSKRLHTSLQDGSTVLFTEGSPKPHHTAHVQALRARTLGSLKLSLATCSGFMSSIVCPLAINSCCRGTSVRVANVSCYTHQALSQYVTSYITLLVFIGCHHSRWDDSLECILHGRSRVPYLKYAHTIVAAEDDLCLPIESTGLRSPALDEDGSVIACKAM